MHKKITITCLFLTFLGLPSLVAQPKTAYYLKPRKHAFYAQGLAVADLTVYNNVAVAGFTYEQALYIAHKEHFRFAGVVGSTPPMGGDINFFTYHIGPKLYWGDKTTWFTVDMQYFGVLGKIDTDPSGAPIGPFYTNAGYLGIGYCYTGPHGFFFNPQFIVEGDEYYKSLNFGLSLGIGYCF